MVLLKRAYKCHDGSIQTRFVVYKCNYCGKQFIKFENKTMYCSNICKTRSTQDNKAKYQRKYRKQIREGHIIVREKHKLGGMHIPKKLGSWDEEFNLIKKLKKSVGII